MMDLNLGTVEGSRGISNAASAHGNDVLPGPAGPKIEERRAAPGTAQSRCWPVAGRIPSSAQPIAGTTGEVQIAPRRWHCPRPDLSPSSAHCLSMAKDADAHGRPRRSDSFTHARRSCGDHATAGDAGGLLRPAGQSGPDRGRVSPGTARAPLIHIRLAAGRRR